MQAMVAELNSAIITAQSDTVAVQAEQFGLIEKVRKLEAQLAEVESWDHALARYELVDFGAQTFAYQLKQSGDGDGNEPPHQICPKCVANKKKSILQFDYLSGDKRRSFNCPECEKSFLFGARMPEPPVKRRTGNWMG